jgi:hypothetical protein
VPCHVFRILGAFQYGNVSTQELLPGNPYFLDLFVLSGSFNSGFGEAVDLEGPVVTLDSHNNLDFVGADFVLYGSAKDNVGVTEVRVTDRSTGQSWIADLDTQAGTWTLALAGINDGDHVFVARGTDKRANTSSDSIATVTLTVDTMSPASLIASPVLRSATYLQGLWSEGQRDFDTLSYLLNQEFQSGVWWKKTTAQDLFFWSWWTTSAEQNVVYRQAVENGSPLPGGVTGTVWNWSAIVDSSALSWGGQGLDPELGALFFVRVTTVDQSGNTHILQPSGPESPAYLRVSGPATTPGPRFLHPRGGYGYSGGYISGNGFDDDGIEKI